MIIKCLKCGSDIVKHGKRKKDKDFEYYRCGGYSKGICTASTIRRDTLNNITDIKERDNELIEVFIDIKESKYTLKYYKLNGIQHMEYIEGVKK